MKFEEVLETIGAFKFYQWSVMFLISFGNFFFLLANVCVMDFAKLPACNGTQEVNETDCVRFESMTIEWDLEEETYVAPLLNSITMVGFVFGAIFAGHVSDRYGRRTVWLLSATLLGIFGFASGFSPKWGVFAVGRFLVGFFVSSLSTSVTTYSSEVTTSKHRVIMIVNFLLSYELGFVWLGLIAEWTRNWRTLIYVTNVGTIPVVLGVALWISESPRWLYKRGKNEAAHLAVQRIADRNGNEAKDSACLAPENEETPSTLGWKELLGEKRHLWRLIPSTGLSFGAYCTYYGFLFNAGSLGGPNKFLSVIIFGLVKLVPGIGLVVWNRVHEIPRKPLLATSSVGGAVCLVTLSALIATESPVEAVAAVSLLGSCFAFCGVVVAILYPTELFETLIRNRACGVTATGARLGGVLAPLILYLGDFWLPLPYLVFALITLCTGLLAALTLPETLNLPLPE